MTAESQYNSEDYRVETDEDEHLTRVVIDTCARSFYLYSNEGDAKVVECDTSDEFMNVLTLVRAVVNDDIIAYTEMRVKTP